MKNNTVKSATPQILQAIGLFAMSALLSATCTSCKEDDYDTREPKIYFSSDGKYLIGPTDTLVLTPRILYDNGSGYTWQDKQTSNIISNDINLTFTSTALCDYNFLFAVDNGNGQDTASVFIRVAVLSEADSVCNCTTSTKKLYLQPDTLSGAFVSKGIVWNNVINADTTAWVGFALCNRTTIDNSIGTSTLGTAYINGTTSTNAYFAVNASDSMAKVVFPSRTYSPISIDIANDNLMFLASKFGMTTTDSVFISPASQGDYFRVFIEGIDANGMTNGNRASFDLIECSYDNPAKYVRHADWTTISLRTLGQCNGLLMSIESNRSEWISLPFFCVNNLILQD